MEYSPVTVNFLETPHISFQDLTAEVSYKKHEGG